MRSRHSRPSIRSARCRRPGPRSAVAPASCPVLGELDDEPCAGARVGVFDPDAPRSSRVCSTTSARPSPVPDTGRAATRGAPRKNRSKIRSRSSSGTPSPASSTVIRAQPSTVANVTAVMPPPWVRAFSSRLVRTRFSRRLSVRTGSVARWGSISTRKSASVLNATEWRTSSARLTGSSSTPSTAPSPREFEQLGNEAFEATDLVPRAASPVHASWGRARPAALRGSPRKRASS